MKFMCEITEFNPSNIDMIYMTISMYTPAVSHFSSNLYKLKILDLRNLIV